MRGASRRWLGYSAIAAALALLSCSLTNQIDACDKSVPTPVAVNQRVDGTQKLGSSRSMAVMPSGETLVMFNSSVDTNKDHQEARAVRITSSGAPVGGCIVLTEREQVLFPVNQADPSRQLTSISAIARPPAAKGLDSTGLALLTHGIGSGSTDLVATTFAPQGCFVDLGGTDQGTVVRSPPPDRVVLPRGIGPLVLSLSPENDHQRYILMWTEMATVELSFRAMALPLSVSRGGIIDTDLSTGQLPPVVELGLAGGPLLAGLEAFVIDSDVHVFWAASKGESSYALFTRTFDSKLQPKGDVFAIETGLTFGALSGDNIISAAYDGDHVLVVWTEGTRAVARSYLPDGSSAGDSVELGSGEGASDSQIKAASVPGGGFLVLWRQQIGAASGGNSAVGFRMVALDTYGRKVFNNMACDQTDFQLVSAGSGDLGEAALDVTLDDRVVAAYTASGAGQSGLVQSDVKLLSFTLADLFPGGTLRSATATGGTVGPPPAKYDQSHPSCTDPHAGKPDRACRCNDECDPGGRCLTEEIRGLAGGTCRFECVPGAAGGCPAGSTCEPSVDDPTTGACRTKCKTDSDCGFGRICAPDNGTCFGMCNLDSDCRTGVCDHYTNLCGTRHSNPGGVGLGIPCSADLDCKSNYCGFPGDAWYENRCVTDCRTDVSGYCPEGATCISLSASYGSCAIPCVNGSCSIPGLVCTKFRDGNDYCVIPTKP
jgi:hypothetical protein